MSQAALGWVKPELDETLRLARAEVEYFAEDPNDTARMHLCAGYLHQVQGTLRMVELYAPAMVADELDQLAQALRDRKVEGRDDACATLMRGTVLLPDYLERLQSGHREIPIVLLPLLNEVRAARGEPVLSEGALRARDDWRSAFKLDDAAPSETELDHARGSLSGRNRDLLNTVGGAVKEELLRVKDALDLHLRTGGDATTLQPQVGELANIGETLGMLGLDAARGIVLEQRDALATMVAAQGPADEVRLLDIAGALLYVDATLDGQVASLGAGSQEEGAHATDQRHTVGVLAQAAIGNFAAAREGFVAFIETNWNHDQLADVPRLLAEVSGALRILDLPQPADYLEGVRRYVRNELIGKRRVPGGQQLDTLADAMASLEYYLEALRDARPNQDDILDIARSSLEALSYWPLPTETEDTAAPAVQASAETIDAFVPPPLPELVAAETTQAESPVAGIDWTDVGLSDIAPAATPLTEAAAFAAALPTPAVAAEPVMPAQGGFDMGSGDIDDEIREVFLEEFDEEIVNLDHLMPGWRAAPEEMDKLRPIRRVFHTLKGSGRLVGATMLGEFAWKVENMLNRVLDGSRPPSDAVIALLGQVAAILPQLSAALRGQGAVQGDIEGLKSVAERIAAGEEAYYRADTATPAVVPVIEAAPVAAEPEGTPAAVDGVLREILETEVATHLQTVRTWLARAATLAQPVDEGLLRALHTMNGAFAMADVPEITRVTAPAEQYVKRLLPLKMPVSTDGVSALDESVAAITRTMSALREPMPRIPVFAELGARLTRLCEALPVPAPETELPTTPVDEALIDNDLSAYMDAPQTELPPPLPPVDEIALQAVEPESTQTVSFDAGDDFVETISFEAELPAEAETAVPAFDSLQPEEAASTPTVDIPTTFFEISQRFTLGTGTPAAAENIAPAIDDSFLAEEIEFDALPVENQSTAGEEAAAPESVAEPSLPVLEIPDYAALGNAGVTEAAPFEYALVDELSPIIEAAPVVADEASVEIPAIETVEIAVDETPATFEYEAVAAEAPVEALPIEVADEAVPEAADSDALSFEALEPEVAPGAEAEGTVQVEAAAADSDENVFEATEIQIEAVADEAPIAPIEPTQPETDSFDASVDEVEATAFAAPVDETPLHVAAPVETVDLGPLDATGLDLELVDIFVEEGNELLDHSDGLLAKLREAQDDRNLIIELQRDLHTLKGGARMAGINAIGDLGHAIESLLEQVAAQRVELGLDGIRALERGFDNLHAMLAKTGEHRAVAIPTALIVEFNVRAQGAPLPAAAETAEAVPLADLKPLSAPVETVADAGVVEEMVFPQGGQEHVRIRADLLDRLVNYAGEVAIYRARLEQQLGAFRGAMGELDRTNTRLHDQLRRLDLETEAQIVARYQREQDRADPVFDPLELDRFSTLQQLSRALGESAADLAGLQNVLDDLSRQYDGLLQQQSRVSSELQDGLMRARMLPFDSLVPRLRRVLRQAAADTGKQARLELDGAHGELDRNVLERMTAPLEHLMRNAVAHGLETPEARRAAGKGQEGTVRIRLRREGSEMVLQVSDDGAGINHEAIRRRAVERGLIAADAQPGNNELERMILESGFSTAEDVSQLAGRGVGMDVVYSEVRQLGGSLDIGSVNNKGTTFTLRLPQTLAVTQAVFVQIGETQFAVPVAAVGGIGRIARERFDTSGGVYLYGGQEYTLYDLGVLTGHEPAKAEGQPQIPLLLVNAGDLRAAVAVDQVLGNREIVVKPVGPQLTSVPGIYGATITGDGSVVVILDAAPLVRRYVAQPQAVRHVVETQAQRRVPLVMVVDDSLTMRKVTGRVLERHNLEVAVARDGVEALEKLEDRIPDLMLLDIEMPRMDGYELATAMRADPRYRNVPIVMITSRTGDKHRQRAFEIGVQRYMGKPYQELDLMRNVYDLLGIARVRE